MPKSYDVLFASSNTHKYEEAEKILAEFGIHAPLIHFVDIINCDIIMQKIDGVLVRDLPNSKLVNACKKIGRLVGTMHKNGITHGDLTTSNFIISKGNIFIIDFGLANRTQI